ncbi:UPF0481 protein [Cinnamomum micranthum f. kanehirae]|uniref:UPF0481 protein n=1 Tax=Cinnamomum micranthum f. kanehirae TaxID=337451 RepID=A0A443N073_9MAGN|nr:UPF0481 protein [Cinnamomum micranthum f. kanehirae]
MEENTESEAVECNQSESVATATVYDLTNSMKDELASNPYKPSGATILRVPDEMRNDDPGAYIPKVVSIGPFHRSRQNVKHMEVLKWHYLRKFLDRKPENDLQMYVQEMKQIEERARSCYELGNIEMKSEDFVKMMVLDGCFIIQLLLQLEDGFLTPEDPIYCDRWTLPRVAHDMLLLENQLPFCVLERLWELTRDGPCYALSIRRSVLNFFRNLLPEEPDLQPPGIEVYHILHLLHSSLRATPDSSEDGSRMQSFPHDRRSSPMSECNPRITARHTQHPLGILPQHAEIPPHDRPLPRREVHKVPQDRRLPMSEHKPPAPPKTIPTVTELQEAGVKFKRKKAKSILDIDFKHGLMEIPRLTISDTTNSLFRNFIALEQCLPWSSAHFTSYCIFMDSLINTPRDVQLLYQSDIIEHVLGSDEEVAILFNKLCKGITWDFKNSYLANKFEEVIEYSQRKWPKWRAKLVRDYFSNPWAILSLAAAIYVIILTSGQTFFAVLAYFCPPRS